MKLLKSILVAVDFDDTLDAVLAAARALAKQFGSEIVLTHIVEAADEFGHPPDSLRSSIAARLGQMQQQLIASGLIVPRVFCLGGSASVEIVEAAERIGTNLILVGARGNTTDHHFPLGTTAEKVIRWSPKPVLAVPGEPPLAFANIVCPVDFSDDSARGLTIAVDLARAFGGKLHILTVIRPLPGYHRLDPHWAKGTASAEQSIRTECQRELDRFLNRFEFKDVAWEKHVLAGDPAREIVQWARSTNADLILMGSAGRTGLPYLFMGSTAVKVAQQLPCALLVAKRMQVLVPDVAQKITDINASFEEGQDLLTQGFCKEAIARFDQCLHMDARCADAVEAKAEALDRLGRQKDADECRRLAETIRRELWEQRVTASVRAQHPFFRRRTPYE
ncbi:MAG TPA: universal stress protein [Gemmataceae bacterium]|nr:universal stress protein [Gemmataceae bacterium]